MSWKGRGRGGGGQFYISTCVDILFLNVFRDGTVPAFGGTEKTTKELGREQPVSWLRCEPGTSRVLRSRLVALILRTTESYIAALVSSLPLKCKQSKMTRTSGDIWWLLE